MREVHGEPGGAYGFPWVTAELRETGLRVNENHVARAMRVFSIPTSVCADASAPPSQTRPSHRCRTCSSGTSSPPDRPEIYGGTTYLRLAGGDFLFLAAVLDCFSRKAGGWSIVGHMRTGLVADSTDVGHDPRQPRRGGVPLRPRSPIRIPGLRRPLRPARCHPGSWPRSAPARTTRLARVPRVLETGEERS
ncbi:IS3 family transposase [Streptomyces virginiae]|uniref:IS3 family transposase n=1 Tax=Streptomyces virginiae TaxID=1961 RepID=UPI0033194934